MPYATGREFARKHNHKLKGKAASKAKNVFNAMVAKGVPESEAFATANARGEGKPMRRFSKVMSGKK